MWRSTVSEAWGLPTNQEDPTRPPLITDSMKSIAIREPMRKSLPVRRLQIWGPEERDGKAAVVGQRNRPLPYPGPDTAAQLAALKYLQYVAAEQESAVDVGFVARRWLLPVVVALQVALSARLIWANTAFQDEGLYLWAGHLEWAHWLHGTQIPDYASYFSGAPVLYPPLGALANHYGGLAGARLLSLSFMLLATILLHGITRRLFNRGAANFAASLFGVLAATEFLGAFATYDAMALTLMAVSAWLAVVSAGRGSIVRTPLLLLSGIVCALADATKYATALWTPIVIGLVVLLVWRRSGRGAGIIFTLSFTLSIAIGLHVGGASYWQGVKFTTLSRQQGDASPIGVLYTSLGWIAVVLALAVMRAIMISSRERGRHGTGVA